jgi:hypothetical protein
MESYSDLFAEEAADHLNLALYDDEDEDDANSLSESSRSVESELDENVFPAETMVQTTKAPMQLNSSFIGLEGDTCSNFDDEPIDCFDNEDGDLEEQHQKRVIWKSNVKSNLTPHKLANISFLRRERCAWVFLLLVVGVIMAGVISQLRNNRKQEQLMIEPSRTEVVIQFLLGKQVSTKAELRVLGTPEQLAASFLSSDEAYYMMGTAEDDRFIERFALAVFYYHFHGEDWTYQLQFMTGRDHCDWFEHFFTVSGNRIREGVKCDDNGYVTSLVLRKCIYIDYDSPAFCLSWKC